MKHKHYLLKNINEYYIDLWQNVKIKCFKQDITIRNYILTLMESDIKNRSDSDDKKIA
jgi:hypothetical protein